MTVASAMQYYLLIDIFWLIIGAAAVPDTRGIWHA